MLCCMEVRPGRDESGWMCGVKVKDRVPSKEMREKLGIDDNLGTTAKRVAMVWAYVAKKTLIG